MGCMTTYLQNKLLAALFTGVSYTPPTTCYVGLCTSVTAGGVITGEPSGNNYARAPIAVNNTTVFAAPASGSINNANAAINFNIDNTSNWGTLTTWFIADAVSGGNVLVYGSTSGNTTITVNQQPYVLAGQLIINGSAW